MAQTGAPKRLFLLERYLPPAPIEGVLAAGAEDREAARALGSVGLTLRHLRTVYVPTDETCFTLFEAASESVLREAATRGLLSYGRLCEAFEVGVPSARGPRSN